MKFKDVYKKYDFKYRNGVKLKMEGVITGNEYIVKIQDRYIDEDGVKRYKILRKCKINEPFKEFDFSEKRIKLHYKFKSVYKGEDI